MSFAAVLLAGGASRRMGRDKAELAWSTGTLLAHQAQTLRATGAHALLLSCRPDQLFPLDGFTPVPDRQPDAGPAAALAEAWRGTEADVIITLAVDLPRMPADFLRELALAAEREQRSIVPIRSGRYEPLAAAWHRTCLPEFAEPAGNSLQRICGALEKAGRLQSRAVAASEESFFANLNTPDDYAAARSSTSL